MTRCESATDYSRAKDHVTGMDLEVIVFNYNYGSFLGEALAGIAAQTLRPTRTVVSDDCSPLDAMRDLQETITAQLPAATLVQNPENLGALEHYRKRTAEVSCDAYMVHSADDLLTDKDFLRNAIEILEENDDIIMVFGKYMNIDIDGNVCGVSSKQGWNIGRHIEGVDKMEGWSRIPGDVARSYLFFDNVIPAICNVIRSSVHQSLPPFPIGNPHVHDWAQWFLMTYYGNFARIDRYVINNRVHEESLSETFERNNVAHLHYRDAYMDILQRDEVEDSERCILENAMFAKEIEECSFSDFIKKSIPSILDRDKRSTLLQVLSTRIGRKMYHLSDNLSSANKSKLISNIK